MTKLREAVSKRKDKLIQELLALGIYIKDEHHLYELTLSEIETEYQNERKKLKSIGQPKA